MQTAKSRIRAKALFPIAASVSIVTAAHIIFMLLSGKSLFSPNPYNSYTLQAVAWSHGNLFLSENRSWLELAVCNGNYYVSFPPFPSYLLFPFALFCGEKTPDSLLAFCIMLIGVAYSVLIAKHHKLTDWQSILLSSFLYCSNNVWMVTVDAWVWFFAQNMSLTLTIMSFYYGSTGKFGRSLFFLAAAVGCRPFQIVYLPVILLMLFKAEIYKSKRTIGLFIRRSYRFLPALILGISYIILNILRFGEPFEFGHSYLPEFLKAEHGQFSLSYLSENLHHLFELPSFDPDTKTIVFQKFNGTNIFIVFPIFLIILLALLKLFCLSFRGITRPGRFESIGFLLTLGLIFFHIFLLCLHRTMGGAHFGNRYIVDTMPAAYLLSAGLMKFFTSRDLLQNTEKLIILLCSIFGFLINFTGVLGYYTA